MIFEILYDSVKRGELILISGGFCHWHLRKDGQLTIREIISIRPGAGKEMLDILKKTKGAKFLYAKCPCNLVSNDWYKKCGFQFVGQEKTPKGRTLNLWRYQL